MADTIQELYDELSQPFPIEYISWRVGATRTPYESEAGVCGPNDKMGKPLCYVDARAVMDRLDGVCGPGNWQNNYTPGVANSIVCNIGIRMPGTGEWVWKADGAGASDVEGEKGMLSDALKRAAVHWGVGRYLYDLDAPFIVLERGKFISKKAAEKLNELHDDHARKCGWGGPTAVAAYRLLVSIVQQTVTQASDVAPFREKYKGMLPQLRVSMRRHLDQLLDNIGSSTKQAAE